MTTENTAQETPYNSLPDTLAHIARVNDLLCMCAQDLTNRGSIHDMSKTIEPEKSGFDACVPKLKNMKYGSEEYRAALREIKPVLEHHYQHNSHHPEHFAPAIIDGDSPLFHLKQVSAEMLPPQVEAFVSKLLVIEQSGVNGMNLFDVIEMLMDWKAATERMQNGGDIRQSLVLNIDRFGLSSQLASILRNTIEYMQW